MIWCWEVIRRFLSQQIRAPKLKRPQCEEALRSSDFFGLFPCRIEFVCGWKYFVSLYIKAVEYDNLEVSVKYVGKHFWQIATRTETEGGVNISWHLLATAFDHQFSGWLVVMIHYQFFSPSASFLIAANEDGAPFKISRHFHNNRVFTLMPSFSSRAIHKFYLKGTKKYWKIIAWSSC